MDHKKLTSYKFSIEEIEILKSPKNYKNYVEIYQGRFQRFWSGGWQIEREASRRFLPPPCEFYNGVPTINPQTYKHRADI